MIVPKWYFRIDYENPDENIKEMEDEILEQGGVRDIHIFKNCVGCYSYAEGYLDSYEAAAQIFYDIKAVLIKYKGRMIKEQ